MISGIAPRARLAVYKACWIESTQARAVCNGSDQVAGKIVVCDGGTYDPGEKSREVLAAGGAGMLLLTEAGGRADQESLYHLPTSQLAEAATTPVRAYAATEGASVVFGPAANEPGKIAPVMASFSSRGPNLATVSVLKPDLSAPGVDILAATAWRLSDAAHAALVAGTLVPPTGAGLNPGTSMATPHVVGVAALMKQLRPSWSPAAIKSALMTTAAACCWPTARPTATAGATAPAT